MHISEEHQCMLRDLLERFDLSPLTCQTHSIEGDACSVIPEVAAREQVDLIVMGTVARVGLEGYFIGNTAETVLNRVACSVLTIKPEGFVSPIKLASFQIYDTKDEIILATGHSVEEFVANNTKP